MTARGSIVAALIPLALASGPSVRALAPAAGQERGHLMLGVLRSDGILLPFASYNGRTWSTPWPSRVTAVDLPVSLADVPRRWWGGAAPSGWRLWPLDTASPPVSFAAAAPIMVPVGASRRLGLRTTYAAVPPAVSLFELPYPKEGLAVAGDAHLHAIDTRPVDGPEARALVSALGRRIEEAEDEMIGRLRLGAAWGHPIDRQVRRQTPAQLEAWYFTPVPGSTSGVSFVELAKTYPALPKDDGCGLVTFLSGWVYHDGGRWRPDSALRAVITYCDRDRATYMLPFGLLLLRGRAYWVFQVSGPQREWYVVAEVGRGRTQYVAEYQAY